MCSNALPLRKIAAIGNRAYAITVRYSGTGTRQALWQDLWSLLETAKVELHVFDDKYRIGPNSHLGNKKFEVLRKLCDRADPFLDWQQSPLEFPKYPVEEDIWFQRNALHVLQEFYWMRELFRGEHSSIWYMAAGDTTQSIGWFFCLKETMSQSEFMEKTAAWIKEMDDIQNGIFYDFKIVDENDMVVESVRGHDDLEQLLNASHLDDPRFIPLLDRVRAEIFA